MRFRRLSKEELEGLQHEFVQFMMVHGIDAGAWEAIKRESPETAVSWVELFSEFIFEGIFSKVCYLEHFGGNVYRLFHCADDVISMITIEGSNGFQFVDEMIAAMQASPEGFLIKKASKGYVPDRHTEIFRMVESGALVSDGKLFGVFSN